MCVTIVASSNAFVTSSAIEWDVISRLSEWDKGHCVKIVVLIIIQDSLCCARYKIMYVLSWRAVYLPIQVLFQCSIYPHWFATWEINTDITFLWAQKQFLTPGHTLLLCMLRWHEIIWLSKYQPFKYRGLIYGTWIECQAIRRYSADNKIKGFHHVFICYERFWKSFPWPDEFFKMSDEILESWGRWLLSGQHIVQWSVALIYGIWPLHLWPDGCGTGLFLQQLTAFIVWVTSTV